MIYNDLYDLEGFIRINTLNDLKTKNFNLKFMMFLYFLVKKSYICIKVYGYMK